AEPEVKIGAAVGDLRFKDIRYLARSLRDLGEKKAYVLVFVDRGCPLAAKYLPVLQRLERDYRDKGVQFVAVNSGPDDTIAEMAAEAGEQGIEVPVLRGVGFRGADARGVPRTRRCVWLAGQRSRLL